MTRKGVLKFKYSIFSLYRSMFNANAKIDQKE